MITELLTVTDAAYGGALPVTTRHLFAQIINGVPAVHNGGGQFTPVANDLTGSWSYQRVKGNIEVIPSQVSGDPCSGVRMSIPLRIVALLPRDTCIADAQVAAASLRGASKAAKIATGASKISVDRVTWTVAENASAEFNPAPQIPTTKALLIIDMTVTVEASQACISGCEPTDVTCAIIEAASLAKIRECLGDRLQELCDLQPCDPLTATLNGVEIINEAEPCGADITLTCDDPVNALVVEVSGEVVLTLLFVPGADLFGFPAWYLQPQLDPALAIAWSVSDEAWGLWNITGETFEAVSTGDQSSPITATWEGATVIQATIADLCPCDPCDPLTYTLVNTDETELESGSVADPCGASLNLIAPDADVTFDGLAVLSVPSGATGNLDCGTLLDGAYVQDGGSVTGIYLVTGTLNGREVYTKDGTHNLEYTGTRWRLVKPGSDVDAALGSETFPWEADWSATGVIVDQATIGAYCGGEEVPCAEFTLTVNGEEFDQVENPCGATLDVDVVNTAATPVGTVTPGVNVVVPDATVQLKDSAGTNIGSADSYPSGTSNNKTAPDGSVQRKDSAGTNIGAAIPVKSNETGVVATCPDATVQLRDSAANNIGSPVAYLSNSSNNLTAPDGSVQLKDSAANNIGSPVAVRSNQTGVAVTAPDGTVVVKNLNGTTLGSPTVRSNASANYTAPIPLKFALAAGDDTSITWTVTDDEAGTYGTYTQDGSSGTLTYSKNGAAFAALSGAIVLAVADTIAVKRSTFTSAGFIKWAP